MLLRNVGVVGCTFPALHPSSCVYTIPLLQELYRHLEWAESLVWTSALHSPAAAADGEVKERLHHIHLTQRVFLEVWTDQPVGRYRATEFTSLRQLHAWAYPYYARVHGFLASLRAEHLATPTQVPWSRLFARQLGRAAGPTNLGETLYQVVAHSSYHRAQLNLRLRALGVEPALVDYIAWVWLERPAPAWPEVPPAT